MDVEAGAAPSHPPAPDDGRPAGPVDAAYQLHGLTLRIRGDAALVAAIAARLDQFAAARPEVSDLSVELLAIPRGATHQVRRPAGPVRPIYEAPLGEVVYGDVQDLLYLEYGDWVRLRCDPTRGHTTFSVRSSERTNSALLVYPLLSFALAETLKRRGLYRIEAAGLCLGDRAVVLAGPKGSGKSTLALALLRAGFGYLGDDLLLLRADRPEWRVLAFPDALGIPDVSRRWFPDLAAWLAPGPTGERGERYLAVRSLPGVQTVWQAQPGLVIFPRISHQAVSAWAPLAPELARQRLASNVLLTELQSSQAHFQAISSFAKASVAYSLELGDDLAAQPGRIRQLLDEL
jgi:hypothetical protein